VALDAPGALPEWASLLERTARVTAQLDGQIATSESSFVVD